MPLLPYGNLSRGRSKIVFVEKFTSCSVACCIGVLWDDWVHEHELYALLLQMG
jgi:hypothetical protein